MFTLDSVLVQNSDLAATFCFLAAIIHIFLSSTIQKFANGFEEGSVAENVLHLLAEVEVVFGVWSALYLILFAILDSRQQALDYLNSCQFNEPAFVFVVMVICATAPVLLFVRQLISWSVKLLPFMNRNIAIYSMTLILGPLLGSLITEPAAMTIVALILSQLFYSSNELSKEFKYNTMGLLFVNVSIGGTLSHFAAPPVIMVAQKWGWNSRFMLENFGYKAMLAVIASTIIYAYRHRQELTKFEQPDKGRDEGFTVNGKALPLWLPILHLLFLGAIVYFAHYPVIFGGIFLFFLGLVTVTKEFQTPLKLREGLLVAFFLGGLVILGGPQKWWLQPLLSHFNELYLFLGSAALTSFTDNAALTFLGSQVHDLSHAMKYSLLAGAVTGGGLTVIANAPNPAGYGILCSGFGNDGVSPWRLLKSALLPTMIAGLFFWFLP